MKIPKFNLGNLKASDFSSLAEFSKRSETGILTEREAKPGLRNSKTDVGDGGEVDLEKDKKEEPKQGV